MQLLAEVVVENLNFVGMAAILLVTFLVFVGVAMLLRNRKVRKVCAVRAEQRSVSGGLDITRRNHDNHMR